MTVVHFITLIISLNVLMKPSDARALRRASVITRHGQRTPQQIYYYPDTNYSHCDSYLPGVQLELFDELGGGAIMADASGRELPGGRCRCGQLTQSGYHSSLNLGDKLRRRYVEQLHLLPPSFVNNSIYMRSTAVERTLHTLQGIINGLYPELGSSLATLNVVSRQANEENMVGKGIYCPALGDIIETLQHDLSAIDAEDEELKIQAKVIQALGLTGSLSLRAQLQPSHHIRGHGGRDKVKIPPFSWIRLNDAIHCMKEEGMLIPGASPSIVDLISSKALFEETVLTTPEPESGLITRELSDKVVFMSIGPLIQKLLRDLNELSNVPPLSIFSSHDSTIMPLLHALGKPVSKWPSFAASITIELWGDDGNNPHLAEDQNVVVLYSDGSQGDVELFNGTLGRFNDLLTPFKASDEEKKAMCQGSIVKAVAWRRFWPCSVEP